MEAELARRGVSVFPSPRLWFNGSSMMLYIINVIIKVIYSGILVLLFCMLLSMYFAFCLY